MTKRVIHVGVGSFGRRWCTEFLAANVADKTIEVVAIADIDPQALKFGAAALGLPDSKCYADIARAFAENAADFCTVVVPPGRHEAGDRRGIGARRRCAVREAHRRHDERFSAHRPKSEGGGQKDGCHDEPSLRPGQDDAEETVRSGGSASERGELPYFSDCASTWPGAPFSGTRWTIR